MKKFVAILFLIGCVVQSFSQNSRIEKFTSSELAGELNNNRILKIHVPDSYKEDSTRVYPLAIVLDAEYLFDIYVANSKLFSSKDKAPEQIVVGIYQNQKNERKTDTEISIANGLLTETSSKFYKFIKDELLPHIESKYRISPFKTIVGNTITANFANFYLVEQNPPFTAYININPYFSPDINGLFQGKIPSIESNTYFYMNTGKYNGTKRDEAVNKIHYILNNVENESFVYRFDEFDNSTKISSIGQAIPAAIAHIFEMYSAISKHEFDNHIAELSPGEAIEYLERKYVEIQYLFGSNLKIRQRDIFAIESIVLDKEDGAYLEEFGKMINRLYPESPIGDYYIGQYYETGNDLKRALKYYKNGYAKISSDDPNADGYYQNVERVMAKTKAKKKQYEEEYTEDELPSEEESEGEGEGEGE